MTKQQAEKKTVKFETEVSKLLDIVANSLYTVPNRLRFAHKLCGLKTRTGKSVLATDLSRSHEEKASLLPL